MYHSLLESTIDGQYYAFNLILHKFHYVDFMDIAERLLQFTVKWRRYGYEKFYCSGAPTLIYRKKLTTWVYCTRQ